MLNWLLSPIPPSFHGIPLGSCSWLQMLLLSVGLLAALCSAVFCGFRIYGAMTRERYLAHKRRQAVFHAQAQARVAEAAAVGDVHAVPEYDAQITRPAVVGTRIHGQARLREGNVIYIKPLTAQSQTMQAIRVARGCPGIVNQVKKRNRLSAQFFHHVRSGKEAQPGGCVD